MIKISFSKTFLILEDSWKFNIWWNKFNIQYKGQHFKKLIKIIEFNKQDNNHYIFRLTFIRYEFQLLIIQFMDKLREKTIELLD